VGYSRWEYRFIHALLVQEGQQMNRKRVRRTWHEEHLTIKPKRAQKIRTGAVIPLQAVYPNHVWTYDSTLDQTFGGTTLKGLTLTDRFTRGLFTTLEGQKSSRNSAEQMKL